MVTTVEPASQTLAFLFTDIEGSTRLWEQYRERMKDALECHDAILREAVEASNGRVVKSTGDGFMVVFASATDGLSACLKAQHDLASASWGETGALRVRMALHVGEAARRNGDYYGPTLNRAARVMSAGHGGQVLLSAAAAALVVDQLPEGTTLRDLGEQRLLLILDNFEQVTASAPTAAQLLLGCPRLKLLVTSREALHVRGEQLFAVPPLSLPSPAQRHVSGEQLVRYEAIQLFVERAREVRPEFRLTDDNADAVVEICRRLDGLPLAIELATARINVFSPEALRDRLSSRLRLLHGGAQDLPARQQTLRATIEWSYQLLEPGEQRLFELLSVFSGISFDAVEAVAGKIDDLRGTGIDTLDGLASLADKSLIRQAEAGAGEPRLAMLETIREYATERLDDLPDFSAA